MDNIKTVKILDKAIFVFIVIFLVSLTNSIFVNQIGYYGALILLLIKYYFAKENPFSKNGLELPIMLYIAAELISAILSDYHANAFHNVLKRVLLLPILYVMPAIIKTEERGKLVVKVFLGAGLLMIFGYLIVVYQYYISNLYFVNGVGPTFLNIVMTTGGIISFITIILFAFLVNEKQKLIYRIIIGLFFLAAVASLVANYSRAAWMGTLAGILIILLVRRQWFVVSLPIVAVLVYLFISPNQSKIGFYKIQNNEVKKIKELTTEGRAGNIAFCGGDILVADYEEGLLKIDNKWSKSNFKMPSPVFRIDRWTDEYYSLHLLDSRNYVVKISNDELKEHGEFITPGLTGNIIDFNNKLYFADIDSGLTIVNNPKDFNNRIRVKDINNFTVFAVNDNYFSFYKRDTKEVIVYKSKDGIPETELGVYKTKSQTGAIYQSKNLVYFQEENGLKILAIENENLKEKVTITDIKGIVKFFELDSMLYGITLQGMLYKFKDLISYEKLKGQVNIVPNGVPPYSYSGIAIKGDTIITAMNKRNRIGSMVDPYHISNYYRIIQWEIGYKILMDNPIFGVGDIDLIPYFKQYKPKYQKENFGHLHNNYVQVFAILGIFGFSIVMFFFYKIMLINFKIFNFVKNKKFVSSYSLGVIGIFAGFLVSGLAEWNFGDHEIITLVWFLISLNIAFYKLYNSKTNE